MTDFLYPFLSLDAGSIFGKFQFEYSKGLGFNIFQEGGPTFSRGVQLLIPIENYTDCDFPGRGASGPHIAHWFL